MRIRETPLGRTAGVRDPTERRRSKRRPSTLRRWLSIRPSRRAGSPKSAPLPAYDPVVAVRGLRVLHQYYLWRDRLLPLNRIRRLLYNLLLDLFFPISWKYYFPILGQRFKNLAGHFYPYPGVRSSSDPTYQAWIYRREPDALGLATQRRHTFKRRPKISIVTPLYQTSPDHLKGLLQSIQRQTYTHWELCLAVGGRLCAESAALLKRVRWDRRIRVQELAANRGIVGNTNAALALATGDYIAFVDHDDLLPPFALYEVIRNLNRAPRADLLYSDEDKVSADGLTRTEPFFKPDLSPDMLRSYNYLAHLTIIKHSLLKRIGFLRTDLDGSQDYDLVLRAVEKARCIVHIPRILYHWRQHSRSTATHALVKPYAIQAAKRALADHLQRSALPARVEDGPAPSLYRLRYTLREHPRVTIIIPNLNHAHLLKTCLYSIMEKTTYPLYQIVVVDTGSTQAEVFKLYERIKKRHAAFRLLIWRKPFNYSSVNNFAVARTTGELILFLNNDIEVINEEWLTAMVELMVQPDVGAVGAKLYYPDDRLQHGGVIVGLGGVAGHSHKYFPREHPGYFRRLQVVQDLSAVTGACLLVRRKVFDRVGGFDPHYALAFNDVDLCLKVRQRGFRVLWTPFAELYHHESKSRGYEDTPEKVRRFQKEIRHFNRRWHSVLKHGDPFYSPHLTLDREDFSLNTR